MLILVWVYYAALVFLFGAELTAVYAHRQGSRTPAAAAEERARAEGQSPAPRATAIPTPVAAQTARVPEPRRLVAGGSTYRPAMTAGFAVVMGLLVLGVRRRARSF